MLPTFQKLNSFLYFC